MVGMSRENTTCSPCSSTSQPMTSSELVHVGGLEAGALECGARHLGRERERVLDVALVGFPEAVRLAVPGQRHAHVAALDAGVVEDREQPAIVRERLAEQLLDELAR